MSDQAETPPDLPPFPFELECAYCGAMHKPVMIQQKVGEKTHWKRNCAACGHENYLIFHPIKLREITDAERGTD